MQLPRQGQSSKKRFSLVIFPRSLKVLAPFPEEQTNKRLQQTRLFLFNLGKMRDDDLLLLSRLPTPPGTILHNPSVRSYVSYYLLQKLFVA
jgi:hypothetical protein